MSLTSRWRALVVAIVAALSLSGCGYNTIPTLEENAKAKWSEVQSQYQRRADLIPNLVATVQGYAKQEKDVLTSVVEARAKATSVKIDASTLTDPEKMKQFQDAQAQLTGALGRLLAVSEAYPDDNKVRGCASQVWLETTQGQDAAGAPTLTFRGDSDAHIVRGLVALVLALYSGRRAQEIIDTDAAPLFKQLGLAEHLTPQRANGLRSMVERIKREAREAAAA